jgi:hypothetical protein
MTIPRGTSAILLALAAAAAALALLAAAGPAAGGGYSTTTLDPLAAAPAAGAATPVGYTVRMHGVTPVTIHGSGIAIVSSDGARTVFPGRPDGPAGHHVADVVFPAAGTWSWEYAVGAAAVQDLGRIEVAPGAGAAEPAEAGDGGSGPGPAAWALLGATLAAAALLAAVALGRREHRPAP